MTFTTAQFRSLASAVANRHLLRRPEEGDQVLYLRPGNAAVIAEVTCVWDAETGQLNVKYWEGTSLCVDIDVFPWDEDAISGWVFL